MTTALLLAAAIVALTFVAVYLVWDIGQRCRTVERRAEIIRWRQDRVADFPPVTLDDVQADYAAAIGHTLTRANLVTADELADALIRTHEARVFEVVA